MANRYTITHQNLLQMFINYSAGHCSTCAAFVARIVRAFCFCCLGANTTSKKKNKSSNSGHPWLNAKRKKISWNTVSAFITRVNCFKETPRAAIHIEMFFFVTFFVNSIWTIEQQLDAQAITHLSKRATVVKLKIMFHKQENESKIMSHAHQIQCAGTKNRRNFDLKKKKERSSQTKRNVDM